MANSSPIPGARIILIRHGQPAIALRPRTSHHGFADYIDAYELAGLDPQSLPPRELSDLVKELDEIFTSGLPRAHQSAQALAPHAELVADPLFAEAPLASPRIPLLKMRVPKWAVVARVLWHAGYHPEIENYRKAKHRAARAADILIGKVKEGGVVAPERSRERERPTQIQAPPMVALVAHGYFNAMIGRELRQRGFFRTGAHRVRYWNAVIYDWKGPADRTGKKESADARTTGHDPHA
jgi:broad specificity phosphatase PhoE